MDLADLNSVKKFTEEYKQNFKKEINIPDIIKKDLETLISKKS